MPNWTTVTSANLDEASIRGLVQKYRDEAANRGLPDPSTLIGQYTDEVRACIGFSGKYQIDADTTKIPRGLLPFVVRKVLREMSRSLGLALGDDDRDDEKAYDKRLDQIRQGQWPVEAPDDPITSTQIATGPAAQVLSSRRRRFKPYEQRGL